MLADQDLLSIQEARTKVDIRSESMAKLDEKQATAIPAINM